MKSFLALVIALSTPLWILNIFGGIVSGVWLAILGDWGSIGYGIASLFLSHFALAFALMPQIALAAPAVYFTNKRIMLVAHLFGFLALLYLVALITIWCGGVLLFFARRATSHSFIPLLIWSYDVALGPWEYMASKEIRGGGGEAAAATTFFAQIGYVLMILMATLIDVRVIDVLIVFALIMFLGVIIQFVMSIQKSRTERLAPSDI